MIFYSIKGPKYHLDVLGNKLILKKRMWFSFVNGFDKDLEIPFEKLNNLSFDNNHQKNFLVLDLRDGKTYKMKFSTSHKMVENILKYVQKIKNQQKTLH